MTDTPLLDKNKAETLLRSKVIHPTMQRTQIAQLMFERHQHLSAEQVHDKLKLCGSRVSMATVYNTIRLFVDKGLLKEINLAAGSSYYDSNTRAHHHIYNIDSQTLSDIDNIGNLKLPELPDNTVLEGIDIVIRVKNKT